MLDVVLNELVNSENVPISLFVHLVNHFVAVRLWKLRGRSIEFSESWTANYSSSKSCDSTCKMNNAWSSEIREAPLGEETSAPSPCYNNWINEACHEGRVQQIVRNVNSFSEGAWNDCCGSAGKSKLEEPPAIAIISIVISKPSSKEVFTSDKCVLVLETKGKSESERPPDHSTNASVHTVFEQNVLIILKSDTSRLKQSKAWLHEEDNDSSCHDPTRIRTSGVGSLIF